MGACMTEHRLEVGQIWKSNDPRKVRYVRVLRIWGNGYVDIVTIDPKSERRLHGARVSSIPGRKFGGATRSYFTFVSGPA